MTFALVTGASRGIGRAIAERLVANGRTVIASARDAQALHRFAHENPKVLALPMDLAQPGAATSLIDQAMSLGALEEVVLAAGIAQYAPFTDVKESSLRAQFELNFMAPFMMLQRASQRMSAGAIVVIASTLAFRSAPTTSAYAASKAALLSAAKSAALELAPHIRVNVIAPGVVDTAMVRVPRRELRDGEDALSAVAEQLEALRALHPLGRLGTPEEIAQAAQYMLDAPWLTGSVLTVDGGLTLS